jgi:hypothetical protein
MKLLMDVGVWHLPVIACGVYEGLIIKISASRDHPIHMHCSIAWAIHIYVEILTNTSTDCARAKCCNNALFPPE